MQPSDLRSRRAGGGETAPWMRKMHSRFSLIAVIATFVLALWALLQARTSRAGLAALTEKFFMFDHRLVRLGEQIALLRGPAADDELAAPQSAAPAPSEPAPVTEQAPVPQQPAAVRPRSIRADRAGPARERDTVTADRCRDGATLGAAAGRYWLVWLGGAALALGGVFLVKLSIDYGVLTAGVRVVLGVAARYRPVGRRRMGPAPRPTVTG